MTLTLLLSRAPARRIPLITALIAGLCSACGGDTVILELNFPSQDTFIRSSSVEVYGVPLTIDMAGRCPELSTVAETTPGMLGADFESGQQPVCSLRNGDFEVPSVPGSLHAYIAVARDDRGRAYLTGCTVQKVTGKLDRLLLVLSPTATYRTDFPAGTPTSGCTAEQRCGGGCP